MADIKITADNSKALAAIAGVKTSLGGLGSAVDSLNKKMGSFTTALVGAGVVAFTKSLLAGADQTKDLADAIGITSGMMEVMGLSAKTAGSSLEGVSNMMLKMQGNMDSAVDGNKKMQAALKEVGIGYNEIKNLAPDEQFNRISTALAGMTDVTNRAGLATDIFGKAGKSFLWKDYIAGINASKGSAEGYTKSINAAAQISDDFARQIGLIKAEFLKLISPLLQIIAPTNDFKTALGFAKIAAIALAAALAVFVTSMTISTFKSIAGAITSVTTALFGTTAATIAETGAVAGSTLALGINNQVRAAGLKAKVLSLLATEAEAKATVIGVETTMSLAGAQNLLKNNTWRLAVAKSELASATTLSTVALEGNTSAITSNAVASRTAAGMIAGLGTSIVSAGRALLTFLAPAFAAVAIAAAPAWAIIAAVTAVVIVATVIWKAFGDQIIWFAKVVWDYLVKAFNAVNDSLNYVANGIRSFTDSIGLTTARTKEAIKPLEDAAAATTDVATATTEATGAYAASAEEIAAATKALSDNIKALQTQATYSKNVSIMGELEATIIKTLAEEKAKLALVGMTLTAVQAKEIETAIRSNKANEDAISINNTIRGQIIERANLNIQDVALREQAQVILEKQLELGRQLTDSEIKRLTINTSITQEMKSHAGITESITALENDNYLLAIKDVREREIQSTLRQEMLKYGSALSQADKDSLESALRTNQALKDRTAIQESLATYRTPQKGIESAVTAAGQMGTLDPVTKALTDQATINNGLKTLRDQGLISEQEYNTARVSAAVAANDAIMAANKQMFETQKMYQLQGAEYSKFSYGEKKAIAAEAADFEMKSDTEKAMWAIQQSASTFAALGGQNKKAFEASKALNIAMAIMNTYMGATKALATYPWPFGLIAAGLAIASGFAQVAQIRSQHYSGRAVGGPVVGGQSYMVGEKGPELFTPGNSGSITKNSQMGGGAVTVNFSIVANDTTGFDELLSSRKGIIQTIISDAMLEKGQR